MYRNKLIAKLRSEDRELLLAEGEEVDLERGQVLYGLEEKRAWAFFPSAGVFCLLAGTGSGAELGVALVGREGMLGMHLLLGAQDSAMRVFVQTGGRAWRVGVASLNAALDNSTGLKTLLLAQSCAVVNQIASSSACVLRHTVACRLARWLLVSRDLAEADSFSVTHEVLARMLGVYRERVTGAASQLQRSGLIYYSRGLLSVLDAAGLRAVCCECYAASCKRASAAAYLQP